MSDAQDELGSNLPQLDHDNNGKAGGSKKRTKATPTDRTWILLEENDDIPPTGLFIGHNGNGYLLVAGEPICVPNFVIEILDHAVTSMPQLDPSTKRVIGHRDRMRFPYRKVAAPAEAS